MYFKQLVKEDLGCASYIVGCTSAGTCAIIDPRLDMVDDILELTAAKGLQVKAVIETHNHADHVSGHGELSHRDRKSTRLNSSHVSISYAVFCLKKKSKRCKDQPTEKC